MRAYFVQGMSAAEVAARFGYSIASVHQLATLLRTGKLALFADARPGPKSPRKATKALRARILELRAAGRSVTEIAAELARADLPVSTQTVWQILADEGLPRLPRRAEDRHLPPAAQSPAQPVRPVRWPAARTVLPCRNAGLLMLLTGLAGVGFHELADEAGYPSPQGISGWQSLGIMLLAKCRGWERKQHGEPLAGDAGLAFAFGLTALPPVAELAACSWQAGQQSDRKLLAGLVRALAPHGLASGRAGFNCDVHTRRGRTTFYAQDHASAEMIYVNADASRSDQAIEILEFADYWREATGEDPGLLSFDAQLTTYRVLDELSARALCWLCPRQRGRAELARLAALPSSAWSMVGGNGLGRGRRAWRHEDTVRVKGITREVRQIAVIHQPGAPPVLLITNDWATAADDLIARHQERLATAQRPGVSLDGLRLDLPGTRVAANGSLDAALTVVADSLYRLLADTISDREEVTTSRLRRLFPAASGALHVTERGVTCTLTPQSWRPGISAASLTALERPIPWWGGRTLRYQLAG
jgi:transposase